MDSLWNKHQNHRIRTYWENFREEIIKNRKLWKNMNSENSDLKLQIHSFCKNKEFDLYQYEILV